MTLYDGKGNHVEVLRAKHWSLRWKWVCRDLFGDRMFDRKSEIEKELKKFGYVMPKLLKRKKK